MNTNEQRNEVGYLGYRAKGIHAIYLIVSTESGNFYVGSAVDVKTRWSLHRHQLKNGKHANAMLRKAWEKYGEDGLSFQIIEQIYDKKKLIEREQFWMDLLKPKYNICPKAASQLGVKRTSEQIERIVSAIKRRLPRSLEAREKQRQAMLGQKRTPEQRMRLSKALTGLVKGVGVKHTVTPKFRASIISNGLARRGKPGWIPNEKIREKLRLAKRRRDMVSIGAPVI